MHGLINRSYVYFLLRDEKGQGLLEYGLILVLVSIVAMAIMFIIGQQNVNMFSNVNNAMNA